MAQSAAKTQATSPLPPTQTSDRFQDEVEKALKHFHDPRWLAQQSPLASPYFLGDAGQDASISTDGPTQLGQRLQQHLRQAAELVTAQDARHGDFRKKLLELRYFDSKERTETQIVDLLVHRSLRSIVIVLL